MNFDAYLDSQIDDYTDDSYNELDATDCSFLADVPAEDAAEWVVGLRYSAAEEAIHYFTSNRCVEDIDLFTAKIKQLREEFWNATTDCLSLN